MTPSFQEAYYASYFRHCCLQNVYLEFLKTTIQHWVPLYFLYVVFSPGRFIRGTNPHFPAVPGMSHPQFMDHKNAWHRCHHTPPEGNVWETAGTRQRRSPVGVERDRPTSEGRKCFWDHWFPLSLLALTTLFWNPCVFLASRILPV